MNFLRRHSSFITVALVLLVFPVQAYAASLFDLDLTTFWQGFNRGLQEAAYFVVINGLGLLVWFGALILDFAINTFVIGFGDTFVNSGIGLAVNQTWIIIRDFVNMFFIFGFVYIGFKMILNSSDSNTRRWLVNILLAALLVNFSLFITKFAIDFSNQLASQIAVNGLGSTGEWDAKTGLYEVNLTSEFMARMGISTIMGIQFGSVEGGGWGYVIGTAILFLTAAFVFAAGGIILIIRFAMLNLFMMLSPVMFLSWVLPPVRDTMQRFWSSFFGRAMYAPIYLLFIYFSLQVIAGLQISVSGENNDFANPNWAGAFQSLDNINGSGVATGTLGTLPFFILICVFLALSISFADKLGSDGGSMAVKLGKSLTNKTRRFATAQTAGRGLREIGRMASVDEGQLNARLARMSQGGAASRAAARFLDRTAGAGLRNLQNSSAGGSESYSAQQTRVGQQNVRLNQMNQENTRADRVGTEQNNQNNADTSTEAGRVARRDASNAMGGQMRRMSNDEILAMIQANPTLLQSAGFAQHLTDGHMTAIRDSGTLTNAQHTALGDLRNDAVIDETAIAFNEATATAEELNGAFNELGQTIRNMSADRKAGLGAARLAREDVAVHLSDRDIEQLEQSGRFSATEIGNIRNARGQAQTAIASGARVLATGDVAVAQEFFRTQRQNLMSNPQQAGQMPVDVFSNPDMREHLTPEAVAQRLRNGVNITQRDAIRDNIDEYINTAPDIVEQRRRTQIWQRAAQGGANSSFISGLGLRSI